MANCFFVSDLHGRKGRCASLFAKIAEEKPDAVFVGGDILPSAFGSLTEAGSDDFLTEYFAVELIRLRAAMENEYPEMFLILGNDDPRVYEEDAQRYSEMRLWKYVHGTIVEWGDYYVCGYSYVPPSPFLLKDWERYDVSRYVDPGSVSPEEGYHTTKISAEETKYSTIADDLMRLTQSQDLSKFIFLYHTPPHDTNLDQLDTGGRTVEHVPIDPHVGSIAVRRMIESRQPLLTLHGHIHESTKVSGSWRDQIGRTHCFNAAYEGEELSLVRFDLDNLQDATRELI